MLGIEQPTPTNKYGTERTCSLPCDLWSEKNEIHFLCFLSEEIKSFLKKNFFYKAATSKIQFQKKLFLPSCCIQTVTSIQRGRWQRWKPGWQPKLPASKRKSQRVLKKNFVKKDVLKSCWHLFRATQKNWGQKVRFLSPLVYRRRLYCGAFQIEFAPNFQLSSTTMFVRSL